MCSYVNYLVSSGCCPDTGPGTSPAAKIGNIADKLLYLPAMKRILRNIFSSVLLLAVLACTKDGDFGIGGTGSDRRGPGVKVVPKTGERRVLLAYSAGFNNLSADLEDDVDDWSLVNDRYSSAVLFNSNSISPSANLTLCKLIFRVSLVMLLAMLRSSIIVSNF